MRTREQPWHLRRLSAGHYQWLRNLADQHALTTSWLSELQIERPAHTLTRGLTGDLADDLWGLSSLSAEQAESLLDDTAPEDVLGRLEQAVWSAQAETLRSLYERVSGQGAGAGQERLVLESVLDHTAWKAGKLCGERRWPAFDPALGADMRQILLALADSPFCGGLPLRDAFLVERAIDGELTLELRGCPHQREGVQLADALCHIHGHWMRGFAYALNHRISIETGRRGSRCRQRWSFISSA